MPNKEPKAAVSQARAVLHGAYSTLGIRERIRWVLLESDNRNMEFWLGILSTVWGVCVAMSPDPVFHLQQYHGFLLFGGKQVWAVAPVVLGTSQAFAVLTNRISWRLIASFCQVWLWTFAAFIFYVSGLRIFGLPFSVTVAAMQFFLMVRRSVT